MPNIPKKKRSTLNTLGKIVSKHYSLANSVVYNFFSNQTLYSLSFSLFSSFFFSLFSLSESFFLRLPHEVNAIPTRFGKSVLQLQQELGRVDQNKNLSKKTVHFFFFFFCDVDIFKIFNEPPEKFHKPTTGCHGVSNL